jgi:site-specific DNA recombinase
MLLPSTDVPRRWSPSTVRGVIRRETYHGVVVWNKTKKKNEWGQYAPAARPESEWVRTTNEDLRIIDEDLWSRVQSRRQLAESKTIRVESGRLSGKPPRHPVANLLSGIAKCGICGGGLVVHHTTNKTKNITNSYYLCHRRRTNGGCTNALRMAVESMNEAVLREIEWHVLTPEAVEHAILLTEREDLVDRRAQLAVERQTVERQIARLVEAIAKGGQLDSLLDKVRTLEARRSALDVDLVELRPVPRLDPEVIEGRLAEWRRILRGSPTQARTVLNRVLSERITFTPSADGAGYDFTAPTRFDKLFTGIVVGQPDRPSFIPEGDRTGTRRDWTGGYRRGRIRAAFGSRSQLNAVSFLVTG